MVKTAQLSKLSKFFAFVFFFLTFVLCTLYFVLNPSFVNAQVPKLKLPCTDTKEPDFQSLRPDQAAPCGDANKAIYCSNDLIFTEDFDVAGFGDCNPKHQDGTFECNPQSGPAMGPIPKHNLLISLDNSQFPIEGNTEKVKNSQNSTDEFNDATKVNEYISWYLSGVNNRAEYGIPTEDQIVNYSGPIQKLIPQAIQEAVRISSIASASALTTYTDEDNIAGNPGITVTEPQTHNQVVVCADGEKATACPGGSEVRLKDWDDGSLSILNTFFNWLGANTWDKKYPPLPWQFKSDLLYTKAYNEWRGQTCSIIPILNKLVCSDLGILSPTRKWSNLFTYVPLAITPDKKGAEYITDVQIKPSEGTEVDPKGYSNVRNAPLYFAHTEETKDASLLLNTTYAPKDVKSVPLPKSTEKNNCSIVNVRTNAGDNLFPGDPDEMQVQDVTYTITQAKCVEKHRIEYKCVPNTNHNPGKCGGASPCCGDVEVDEFSCNAEVTITILTNTKTPFAENLFSTTVADSLSTFRKIYPKVEANAPVYCVADIPTVSDVTYDATKSQPPKGGEQTFKVKSNPKDGTSDTPQLTFPHIGSVYDYFLKGIQTALRPQGYSDPTPISGKYCTPTVPTTCKIDVPDSAVPSKFLGAFKANFIDLANRWTTDCPGAGYNLATQCYNYVVSEAQKAKINPAFVLTIWLNESDASNYCHGGPTTQDFGIGGQPDLWQNFTKQLDVFLKQPAAFKSCASTPGWVEPMEAFLSRFRSTAGTCTPSDPDGISYYQDILTGAWPSVTGAKCIKNGKFAITWPTDMSCP